MKRISIPDLKEATDNDMMSDSKNNEFLKAGAIGPIHQDYPWSNVGLHLYIGRPGSGKTWNVMRHLLITQKLGPFYSKIVYAGRNGENDETYRTHKQRLKQYIDEVKPSELLDYLKWHIKKKEKYYALYKFIMSGNKDPNTEMMRIIDKHGFWEKIRTRRGWVSSGKLDIPRIVGYTIDKLLNKYKVGVYPLPLYVMLDDGSSSDLIAKRDSEIVQLLKHNVRHHHITVGIMIHTINDAIRELRRLISDVVFYKGIGYDDMELALKTIPTGYTIKQIWPVYQSELIGKHAYIVFHVNSGTYEVHRDDGVG